MFSLYSINARWDQTEFHLCCTTFFALQNGKKTLKKKASLCVQIRLALLHFHVIFNVFQLKYVIPASFQY